MDRRWLVGPKLVISKLLEVLGLEFGDNALPAPGHRYADGAQVVENSETTPHQWSSNAQMIP